MELMENGQVETLIVKDMSRLGREYLQVGQYTELIFPSYGVRFIAVNDGVDSLYESTNDFTPFRNLMNEFYAKDCSKKGRSVVRLKAETGARVSSRPRYGYMKDPADPKRHMVPDPETAPVVRYIFDLCVSGKGPAQIAKQLKKDKIPTPGYSYYQKHGVELTGVDITQPSLSSSALRIRMKHWLRNRPGRSYRISASTNGAEPIWLSRISFLDWSTAWTVEAPWYCTGRTPWMR